MNGSFLSVVAAPSGDARPLSAPPVGEARAAELRRPPEEAARSLRPPEGGDVRPLAASTVLRAPPAGGLPAAGEACLTRLPPPSASVASSDSSFSACDACCCMRTCDAAEAAKRLECASNAAAVPAVKPHAQQNGTSSVLFSSSLRSGHSQQRAPVRNPKRCSSAAMAACGTAHRSLARCSTVFLDRFGAARSTPDASVCVPACACDACLRQRCKARQASNGECEARWAVVPLECRGCSRCETARARQLHHMRRRVHGAQWGTVVLARTHQNAARRSNTHAALASRARFPRPSHARVAERAAVPRGSHAVWRKCRSW